MNQMAAMRHGPARAPRLCGLPSIRMRGVMRACVLLLILLRATVARTGFLAVEFLREGKTASIWVYNAPYRAINLIPW